jgi:hypothetical protein
MARGVDLSADQKIVPNPPAALIFNFDYLLTLAILAAALAVEF